MLRQCRMGTLHGINSCSVQEVLKCFCGYRVNKSRPDIALRDQSLANYKARLRQESSVSPVPTGVAGASVPLGAGHGRVAQPGAEGICDPLITGEPASSWACHQEHAHKLSAYAKQPSVGGQYVGEYTLCVSAWSVPHYDETSDDDNYQQGLSASHCSGAHESGLAHLGIAWGCPERLSCHDWCEAPAGPAPAPLPRQVKFALPRQPVV